MEAALKIRFVLLFALVMPVTAYAAEYNVDLGLVTDFEELRPLIDGCSDIGELEEHRNALESASDLEDLRSFLERIGYVEFRSCPAGVEGSGIEWIY